MYEYKAKEVDVVDGDTIDVVVDLGFHMTRRIRLRLLGVDTHETYGVDSESTEYQKGKREADYVRSWLTTAASAGPKYPIVVRTEKKGAFGRYLAEVERRADGAVLNDDLLDEFDGVGYDE